MEYVQKQNKDIRVLKNCLHNNVPDTKSDTDLKTYLRRVEQKIKKE
jgi:hypothetical protein